VLLPLLARMGAEVEFTLQRRGYYPRGGGEVTVVLRAGRLNGLRLEMPGAVQEIRGIAHVSNLPAHIVERMRQTAARMLADTAHAEIEQQVLGRDQAIGQGGAIVLWARTLSSHAQTTLWLLPQFLPLRASTRPVSGYTRVDVAPG
jgi:RNA 3'-terminal phosphate cyclase